MFQYRSIRSADRRSAEDEGDAESVVALATDRLDRRRLDPGLVREQLVEAALSRYRRVIVPDIGEAAIADYVVGDDQAPGSCVLERPGEVGGGVDLVGIDEGQIEGAHPLAVETRKLIERGALPNLNDLAQPGCSDVLLRDLRISLVRLERDQATARRQRPGQPDRAVTTEGAELEDRFRADRLRQQVQQLAQGRRDLDRWQARRLARPQRGVERIVMGRQQPGHVLVDSDPGVFCHGRGLSSGRVGQENPTQRPNVRAMETASHAGGMRERWIERAERASDAFGLVLLLVLITYVLTSLLANRGWDAVVLTIATSATSVVALVSSHAQIKAVRAALLLSIASVVLAAIAAMSGHHVWLELASVFQITLLAIAMGAVLRRIMIAPEIGSRTILGALSVYAVLGILFTFVYGAIDRIQSGPFFEGVAHPSGSDFLFFSYTTLTTTGYGDLVPGGQPGRMIAGLEMMIGEIFLVTLVAGLVSLWQPGEAIKRRREQRAAQASAKAPPSG